jgi:hypothetical protein
MTVPGGRFFERRDARFIELGRAPETWRRRMDLDGLSTHGGRAFEGVVEAAGGIDMGTEQGHT